MKVIVNGKEQNYAGSELLLLDLIKLNNVKQPDMVSVQLNGSFIPRNNFALTSIKEGDEIDLLYFMGGGMM
jgi:sulfur carrier protein